MAILNQAVIEGASVSWRTIVIAVLAHRKATIALGPLASAAVLVLMVSVPAAAPPQLAGTQPAASRARRYDLEFSTYLGGSGGELLRDMTVDPQGNIHVAGISGSADFPRTPGNLPGQNPKDGAMVAKFDPNGRLLWSRVCGTGREIYFYSVKVDKAGNVFVAGRIGPGFPTTPGAFQPTTAHPCGFIGKMKPDASAWIWASYVGTGYAVRDMAMDDRGDIYGILDYFAESKETLPAEWFAKAYQKTAHGGGNHFGKSDAGVVKISNDGNVQWATWIGGTKGNDWVASLGVDANHCPVLLLRTLSKDMPTTPGATGPSSAAMTDWGEGWLGKLSADGSKLLFGTYIADAEPGAGWSGQHLHLHLHEELAGDAGGLSDEVRRRAGGLRHRQVLARGETAGRHLPGGQRRRDQRAGPDLRRFRGQRGGGRLQQFDGFPRHAGGVSTEERRRRREVPLRRHRLRAVQRPEHAGVLHLHRRHRR